MGYFANGFVFTSDPDFKALSAAIAADRCVRGYKHVARSIWLVDIWKPRGKLRLRHAPFCDGAADGSNVDPRGLDAPTRAFLECFQHMTGALGMGPSVELDYVHLALATAAAARCPSFLFAADDEALDLGCRTAPGSLVSFGCRLDKLSIRYDGKQVTAIPLNFLEDDDADFLAEMIARIRGVPGLSVLAPRDIENGQTLYENPVEQWPKDAGDPAEILGLGTWDPLTNLETDFAVVFERCP